jgi:hypothetical protein
MTTFHRSIAKTALALALLAAIALPAGAQVDAAKLPAAKAAADSFVVMAKGSEKTGEAPRESDPAVKRLIEAVFDTRDVEAAKTIPFQTITQLSERMLTGLKVGVVYMLAGTGAADLNEIGKVADADMKVNLNVIKFAPEMGRFYDFQMRIQGAVIDAVLARMATAKPDELAKPSFVSGLADIRGGGARTVAGVIETLAINGLADQWLRDRQPALAAIAPKLAKFLLPEQKAELQKLAIACANVTDEPQVKQSLLQFAAVVGGS